MIANSKLSSSEKELALTCMCWCPLALGSTGHLKSAIITAASANGHILFFRIYDRRPSSRSITGTNAHAAKIASGDHLAQCHSIIGAFEEGPVSCIEFVRGRSSGDDTASAFVVASTAEYICGWAVSTVPNSSVESGHRLATEKWFSMSRKQLDPLGMTPPTKLVVTSLPLTRGQSVDGVDNELNTIEYLIHSFGCDLHLSTWNTQVQPEVVMLSREATCHAHNSPITGIETVRLSPTQSKTAAEHRNARTSMALVTTSLDGNVKFWRVKQCATSASASSGKCSAKKSSAAGGSPVTQLYPIATLYVGNPIFGAMAAFTTGPSKPFLGVLVRQRQAHKRTALIDPWRKALHSAIHVYNIAEIGFQMNSAEQPKADQGGTAVINDESGPAKRCRFVDLFRQTAPTRNQTLYPQLFEKYQHTIAGLRALLRNLCSPSAPLPKLRQSSSQSAFALCNSASLFAFARVYDRLRNEDADFGLSVACFGSQQRRRQSTAGTTSFSPRGCTPNDSPLTFELFTLLEIVKQDLSAVHAQGVEGGGNKDASSSESEFAWVQRFEHVQWFLHCQFPSLMPEHRCRFQWISSEFDSQFAASLIQLAFSWLKAVLSAPGSTAASVQVTSQDVGALQGPIPPSTFDPQPVCDFLSGLCTSGLVSTSQQAEIRCILHQLPQDGIEPKGVLQAVAGTGQAVELLTNLVSIPCEPPQVQSKFGTRQSRCLLTFKPLRVDQPQWTCGCGLAVSAAAARKELKQASHPLATPEGICCPFCSTVFCESDLLL